MRISLFLLSFMCMPVMQVTAQQQAERYSLQIQYSGKDSSFDPRLYHIPAYFNNQLQCREYVKQLPLLLQRKGFAEASTDESHFDSIFARITLHIGPRYQWWNIRPDSIEESVIRQVNWPKPDAPLEFAELENLQERIIQAYENIGYPFAATRIDSLQFNGYRLNALLHLSRGPLYHIDSIRIIGKARISKTFLEKYLSLPKGCVYSQDKLKDISRRLAELPFLTEQQPHDIQLLGTGSILNLYLNPKKNSQVNFLIGFLPANNLTNKLQLTGDVNLLLKNSFGKAETILVNWQQLQLQSPRLKLGYQQPYLFKSPFGIDFGFDLFKKDSSFLQINALLGIQYLVSAHQSGKLYLQQQSTSLLASGIDTNLVKSTRQLPAIADVKSVYAGLVYEYNRTNFKLNPQKGLEFSMNLNAGIRRVTKSNSILELKTPGFDYNRLYDSVQLRSYQFRIQLQGARYTKTGKRSTLKSALQAGWIESEQLFRNELFQIGGFKLMRGFDEESIFATRYGVLTNEIRYLLGTQSYLFAFSDLGWTKNLHSQINSSNQFISGGIGIVFETKTGILNMSFAAGKRNDVPFNWRSAAKIHFGFVSYF